MTKYQRHFMTMLTLGGVAWIVFLFQRTVVLYAHYMINGNESVKPFPEVSTKLNRFLQHPSDNSTSPTSSTPQPWIPCVPFPVKFPANASFFPCDFRPTIPPVCTHRLRARLSCTNLSGSILYEWVAADTPPATYGFTDECLDQVIRDRCYDNNYKVPRLMHFVNFRGRPMPFYTFVGFLSAFRFMQPCLLLYHADRLPEGDYWKTLVRLLPHILHVKREPPESIFNRTVKVVEHQSDIVRLEAVKKWGGMYIDTDYFILRSLDDLRNFSTVMGVEKPGFNYANGVFLSEKGAPFLELWYGNYRTFNDKLWAYHSTKLPFILHKRNPKVPFHEVKTLIGPWFLTIKKLFYTNPFNWRVMHGIHLYQRSNQLFVSGYFENHNSSLGQVTRHILFGDYRSCFAERDLTGDVTKMDIGPQLLSVFTREV